MKKSFMLTSILIVFVIFAAGCNAGGQKEGEVPEISPISFGYLPLTGYAPVYIGVEKGYFEEEGITLDLQVFKSGALMMPLLATGDLDIGSGQPGPELFNAVYQGLDVMTVAGVSTQREGYGSAPVLVRKDLFDSGEITQLRDLKGAIIAVNVEQGLSEYIIYSALVKAGLSLEDVTLVTLPFPDMTVAFANKAIDAAFIPEPLAGSAVRNGDAVYFIQSYELFDRPSFGIIYFGKRLLDPDNFEVGVRFFKAYVRASRELTTEDGWTDENVEIISSYTNVPASAIKNGVKNYFEPDGYMNPDFVLETMLYYMEQGYTEFSEPLEIEEILDLSFINEAVERLGEY